MLSFSGHTHLLLDGKTSENLILYSITKTNLSVVKHDLNDDLSLNYNTIADVHANLVLL